MTTYTTRTAEFGRVTFTAPAASETYAGHVWIETERDRRQICNGGDFTGSTITATSGSVKAAAQRWMRERRTWRRAEGLA